MRSLRCTHCPSCRKPVDALNSFKQHIINNKNITCYVICSVLFRFERSFSLRSIFASMFFVTYAHDGAAYQSLDVFVLFKAVFVLLNCEYQPLEGIVCQVVALLYGMHRCEYQPHVGLFNSLQSTPEDCFKAVPSFGSNHLMIFKSLH